jgi:hypothetical protein
LVVVEPKIVHCGKANRISVLISRKRFTVPCDRGVAGLVVVVPRRATIPSVSLGAIMWPTGLLDRRMKSDVSNIDSSSYRHGERLNGSIEVLVIERVLIVPHAGVWSRHLPAHEPDTIGAWSRLDLIYRRASPSLNGRLLTHGWGRGIKTERLIDSGYAVLTVRSIVIHVAFRRMRLTPDAFVRDDVIGFGKVLRPCV